MEDPIKHTAKNREKEDQKHQRELICAFVAAGKQVQGCGYTKQCQQCLQPFQVRIAKQRCRNQYKLCDDEQGNKKTTVEQSAQPAQRGSFHDASSFLFVSLCKKRKIGIYTPYYNKIIQISTVFVKDVNGFFSNNFIFLGK